MSGRAAAAARYPQGLLDAMLDSVEIKGKHAVFNLEVSAEKKNWVDDLHEENSVNYSFVDDVTGKELDKKGVEQARAEEMKTFPEMEVYEHVTRDEMNRDEQNKKKIGSDGWTCRRPVASVKVPKYVFDGGFPDILLGFVWGRLLAPRVSSCCRQGHPRGCKRNVAESESAMSGTLLLVPLCVSWGGA